jgi:hypothetical protein
LSALLLAGSGCSKLNPYKIGERAVRDYLVGFIGPARRYHVHIKREGTDLSSGYLSQLTVGADDLRTSSGIVLQRLDADLFGVRFDRRRQKLLGVESSRFTAELSETSANAYLAKHDRGVPGLSVEFEPEIVVVKAIPKLLGVNIPVTLRGRTRVENGNLIRYQADELAVVRLNLPRAAVRMVEQKADPVFDLDDLKLPANLESVESRDGVLLLRGTVKLPAE